MKGLKMSVQMMNCKLVKPFYGNSNSIYIIVFFLSLSHLTNEHRIQDCNGGNKLLDKRENLRESSIS